MSGKGKKSGKKGPNKIFGDVTINEFANAKVCKSRPKKSLNNVMKKIEVDDRPWDEKIDELEEDFDFVEEENEDGSTSFVIKRRRRKKTVSEVDISEREGVEYPLDIWFLISEHIDPEDVGNFAGICKSTYAVVCSAKFWFYLYKRFYKNVSNLPERLQPECMVRLYGLKTCVVRSLYYMYPPFINRIKGVSMVFDHPHVLLKRQCVLMWHTKCKDKWWYFFKLKEHSLLKRCRNNKIDLQPDLLEMLQDVLANQEEGCRILKVSCPHLVPTAQVLGLTLQSVSLTLSQGFIHQRLQMGFGSGLQYSSRPLDASSCTEIILDPVINVRVLDWWHPLYPHGRTMPLLSQE